MKRKAGHQLLLKTWLILFLSILPFISNAEEDRYNLPALDSGGASLYSPESSKLNSMEKSLQDKKRIEQYLKKHLEPYTQIKLTDDSVIYLRSKGFKLKTKYYRGNVSTELEAKKQGDVTFTLKVRF